MSHSTPATAAHSTLTAKPDQRQALWDYLAGIKTAADNGKNLHQWYAYKIDDELDSESFEFGVFSVFADTSARDEYLDGTIPRALESKASQLLTRSPSLNTVNIIASKVSQRDDKLNTTVHATLVAKPDSATQLKSLLSGSYAAAIQEETTTQYWYAYQKDETAFGLFGAFSSHSGLGQHLSGPAVATMAEAAAPLLAQPLQTKKGKIISKKV